MPAVKDGAVVAGAPSTATAKQVSFHTRTPGLSCARLTSEPLGRFAAYTPSRASGR